jgi:hypothetical protein
MFISKKLLEKFSKLTKFFIKVGIGTTGISTVKAGVILSAANPLVGLPVAAAGLVASASAVASAVKDKNLKALAPLINVMACNIDKAENCKIENE